MRLVAVETRRVGRLAGAGARGQRRARGRGHGDLDTATRLIIVNLALPPKYCPAVIKVRSLQSLDSLVILLVEILVNAVDIR